MLTRLGNYLERKAQLPVTVACVICGGAGLGGLVSSIAHASYVNAAGFALFAVADLVVFVLMIST